MVGEVLHALIVAAEVRVVGVEADQVVVGSDEGEEGKAQGKEEHLGAGGE